MRGGGDQRHTPVRLRWSIRTRGLVVIAVPLVAVLANLGVATWCSHVSDRAEASIVGAQSALVAVTGMQSTLLDAQANGAAYLLEHQPTAIVAYRAEMRVLATDLAAVRAAAADAGPAAGAVRRSASSAATIAADMQGLVEGNPLRQTLPHAAKVGRLDTELTANILAIRDAVDRLVRQQRRVVGASGTTMVAAEAAAAAVVIIGGAALSLLFTSRVVRRIHQLERATDALALGEPVGDVPVGPDELGHLGTRLVETAGLLQHHERALERSRQSLDDILAASPVVSLRYDSRRSVLAYASPNVDAMLGVPAERVTADIAAFLDRLHPDDVATIDRAVRAAVAGGRLGEHHQHRLRFRRRGEGGAWREARVTTAVAIGPGIADDGHGDVVAYLVDVTEQLQAERDAQERRSLLESILAASPDHIVVRDAADAIVLSSRHLAGPGHRPAAPGHGPAASAPSERRGTDPADEAGRPPAATTSRRMAVDDRPEIADLVRRTRTGEPAPEAVVSAVTTDGRDLRTFETRARPVVADDGRIIGTVTVSRDVTGRVQLEESLREATASATAASEAKSEFLSRMSHELRTPLNAILGFAQLLALDELPGDQGACVDHIERAGQHLLALIDEVLDISRIESGNIHLSVVPIAVADVMREAANLLGPVADAAQVRIRLAVDGAAGTYVEADRRRLLQVLINLGSNAVKYNRTDGLVSLRAERNGSRVTIAVSDTGPGIPLERQAELFVPFARLGAERTGIEGTGVGLALSTHFVELMGGAIEVESTPGRGATFRVLLAAADVGARRCDDREHRVKTGAPAANGTGAGGGVPGAGRRDTRSVGAGGPATTAPALLQTSADGGGTGRQALVVLHVEDDESSAALVAQVLARRPDVRLVSARTASAGWELAQRHRPDLVLLDIHLPDQPGYELLRRMRSDPDLHDVTVIAVSADATPTRIRTMRRLGVDAYLTKPVDVSTLLGHIGRVSLARTASGRNAPPPGGEQPRVEPSPAEPAGAAPAVAPAVAAAGARGRAPGTTANRAKHPGSPHKLPGSGRQMS